MQNGTASLEDRVAVSQKTKYTLIQTSSCVPGIYPNALKIYVHVDPCTQMYITALFLIAKIWKQPRCPSVNVNNQLTNIC